MNKYGKYFGGISVVMVLCTLVLINWRPANARNLIQNVTTTSSKIDASANETVAIEWKQLQPGIATVSISNRDGFLVRTLLDKSNTKRGINKVFWNGRDDEGQVCPNDVYMPIVKLKTQSMGDDVYNPFRLPWGEEIPIPALDVHYSPETETITYTTPQPAMCRLRVGEEKGGALYKTIFDFIPRLKGAHDAIWDGKDDSGIINVAEIENCYFDLDAYTLPPNPIILTGSTVSDAKAGLEKSRKNVFHSPRGQKTHIHALHSKEKCRELNINVRIDDRQMTQNIPVEVMGNASITVGVIPETDTGRVLNEGFEVYLFMDRKFLVETPMRDIPAQLNLDTAKIENGVHVLTVLLKTTEDHMGISTMKIDVRN